MFYCLKNETQNQNSKSKIKSAHSVEIVSFQSQNQDGR